MTETRKTPVRRTPWPDSTTQAMVTPLQPSVAYVAQDPDALDALYTGQTTGFTYGREGHPNAVVLARKLDQMEGLEGGLVVGSGMAAITATMLAILGQGDHAIGGKQLYGRSLRLMQDDLPRMGIATSFADLTDPDDLRAAIRPETRMVLVEVVSNPTLRVADMPAVAAIAKEAGALLVVDNTFTTPRAVRGIDLGADIVIHSVTKLLAGHSDVTLGYVAARDADVQRRIYDTSVTFGMVPSPYDCWLAERGLYTFELRFDRASATAARLADHLAEQGGIARVLYPGRSDHPDRALAQAILGGRFGNMVSFELVGGREAANALTRAAAEMPFAPTLGDVATTLSHPPSSSHRGLSAAQRAAFGIGEGMFRVSVGIEETSFVLDTFSDALRRI